jgi:hypothetical protein
MATITQRSVEPADFHKAGIPRPRKASPSLRKQQLLAGMSPEAPAKQIGFLVGLR